MATTDVSLHAESRPPEQKPAVNDMSIQVATVNGSGSQSSNTVLLRSIFQMGVPVSGKNLFPSNIAGLPTWYTIRANKDGYIARKKEIDFVVAMNAETAQEDVMSLAAGAAVLYDEPLNLNTLRSDLVFYAVPYDKLVAPVCPEAKLRKLVKNMIYVGVVAKLLEIDISEVEKASSQASVPRTISYAHSFYWSVRRELWENRLVYAAPLAAAAIFLGSFVISTINCGTAWTAYGLLIGEPAPSLYLPFELSAALIMGIALVVGIFYSLDTLYGERRDRSILFWKSMPVSDLTTVLSKLAIPLVVIPVLSFAIALVTQFIMLLLASTVLLGSGANIAALWTQQSFLRFSLELFYHMLTVHGLWYAPLYAWLLLVSATAPRAPFRMGHLAALPGMGRGKDGLQNIVFPRPDKSTPDGAIRIPICPGMRTS